MAFLSLCCPPEDGVSTEVAPRWGLTDAADRRAEAWLALELWGLCCWAMEFSNKLWSTAERKTTQVIKTMIFGFLKACKHLSFNTAKMLTMEIKYRWEIKGTLHQELHWICKFIRAVLPKIKPRKDKSWQFLVEYSFKIYFAWEADCYTITGRKEITTKNAQNTWRWKRCNLHSSGTELMHVKHNTTETTRNKTKPHHKQQNIQGDLLWISNQSNKLSYLLERNVSRECI